MNSLLSLFELPLLKRELIESSQKKRTYILRSICLIILGLVFLTAYFEATNRATNIARLLGSGQEMVMALWISSLIAIYALAPAMSCSAISSEMEKQTMGILLVSKLSPGKIVVEKIASRMIALLSLMIVVCPLYAISYMFGGIAFSQVAWGFYMLFFIIFQVTAVSVYCSAAFRTSLAAFWMTYIILLVWYFLWPLSTEVLGLSSFDPFFNIADEEYMFFPIYQSVMLLNEASTWQEFAFLTVPQLLVTLIFPLAAWRSLSSYVEGESLNFLAYPKHMAASLGSRLQRYSWGKRVVDQAAWVFSVRSRSRQLRLDVTGHASVAAEADGSENFSISDQAIIWRERRSGLFAKFPVMTVSAVGLIFFEWWLLAATRNSSAKSDVCALFSFGLLIAWLLLVLGQSCRIFSRERERQTLSVLLVAPISNPELLNQKLSGVNHIIRKGVWLCVIPCVFNLMCSNFHSENRLTYAFCLLATSYIYMHLVKWTGTYFGLRTNTQMKAMVASLVSILTLCFVPMLLLVVCLMGLRMRPPEFAPFMFSSPIIIPALNEFHDLDNAFRNNWLPQSELLVVLLNLLVYRAISRMVMRRTIRELPALLERIDDPTPISFSSPDVLASRTAATF